MSLPAALLTTTCDIYRPFGAGSPTTTGVACRLVPDMPRGRGTSNSTALIFWSHYIDLNDTVDIRDGCQRLGGSDTIQYGDGDEVRIPNGSGSRYVVVWVELLNRGTAQQFKRVYLLRDTAVWPGP
ncbi:MAG: hypothetical protein ACJ8F7_21050 [Gemmataceae bacterium]